MKILFLPTARSASGETLIQCATFDHIHVDVYKYRRRKAVAPSLRSTIYTYPRPRLERLAII